MNKIQKDIRDAVAFHGHLCPMSVLGARMGLLALRKLGVKRATGTKLTGVVYNDLCTVDGFQVVTGCTTGKRTLAIRNHGMLSAELFDLYNNRGVHVSLKIPQKAPSSDVVERTLEYGAKRQKFVKESSNYSEKERAQALDELTDEVNEIVSSLETLTDEELFNVREIGFVDSTPPQKNMEVAVCVSCGEIGLKNSLTKVEDGFICHECKFEERDA